MPGAPQTRVNPFTGATSLEPVRQFNHAGGGNAVIGGYVYRGPVASLNGKYFYADYVSGRVWQLELDRDADPSTFNGSNGILTDVSAQWNARVVDPNDPRYNSSSAPSSARPPGSSARQRRTSTSWTSLVTFPGQYPARAWDIFRITLSPSQGASAVRLLSYCWPGHRGKPLPPSKHPLAGGLPAVPPPCQRRARIPPRHPSTAPRRVSGGT